MALYCVMGPMILFANVLAKLERKQRLVIGGISIAGMSIYWFMMLNKYKLVPYISIIHAL